MEVLEVHLEIGLVENKIKVKKLIFVCGFNSYLGINEEYDTVNKTMYFDNLQDVKQLANEIYVFIQTTTLMLNMMLRKNLLILLQQNKFVFQMLDI